MPDTTADIGTGELARAVALIRGDIKAVTEKLEGVPTKVELEQRLSDAKALADLKNTLQDKAIAGLEEWNTWALRLGGPTIVALLAGVVFNAARIPGN